MEDYDGQAIENSNKWAKRTGGSAERNHAQMLALSMAEWRSVHRRWMCDIPPAPHQRNLQFSRFTPTLHMKNDKYKSARGGWSRILDILCEKCESHVCYYQKDGPGPLKRMYVDRIVGAIPSGKVFRCLSCKHELGIKTTYKKENRLTYRLFQNSLNKKIIRQTTLK